MNDIHRRQRFDLPMSARPYFARQQFLAALFAALVLTGGRLAAQEESRAAVQAAGGARNLTVENLPEEYEMKLRRADPALLEQKYAAIIRLTAQRRAGSDYRHIPRELLSRFSIGATIVLPYLSPSSQRNDSYAEYFTELAGSLPEHLALTEEQKEFFRTKADDGYLTIQHGGGNIMFRGGETVTLEHEIVVIAPDQKTAESRARAVLHLLDFGVFIPLQNYLTEQIDQANVERSAQQEKVKETEQIAASLSEQVKNAEKISSDALSDLRNQRRFLAVDLAGIEAKIKACAEILERLGGQARQVEQVENIKITAEIELAGLAARRKSLDSIIDAAERVISLQGKAMDASNQRREAQRDLRATEDLIERLRQIQQNTTPPELVDNKIVVRPIKWTGA